MKNLYFQKQKLILEGFVMSLMTRDLILSYRWTDRCQKGNSFKDLKNIQIVLLNTMLQIDAHYTLYQFENDCKVIIKKLLVNNKVNTNVVLNC